MSLLFSLIGLPVFFYLFPIFVENISTFKKTSSFIAQAAGAPQPLKTACRFWKLLAVPLQPLLQHQRWVHGHLWEGVTESQPDWR